MSNKTQKQRLELEQLQTILEGWKSGAISELERDVVLEKLRYLYQTIKFMPLEAVCDAVVEQLPVASEYTAPEHEKEVVKPEEQDEPEVLDEHNRQKMRRNALRSLYDSENMDERAHTKEVDIPENIFDDLPSADTEVAETANEDDARGLHKLIEVNDRFLIVREVFSGDNEAYERAIDELEEYTDLDEAFLHIHEQYRWNPNSEGVKLLIDLLTRKFS